MNPVVRQFVRAAGAPGTAGASDPDLLKRFVDAADQDAFAELVRRHGPMVLDVCRCVLGNRADAEDAFQAAFLALARQAGSIRKSGSLGAWLHGVAYRIARKSRTQAARRREHEARVPAREPAGPDDLSWAEVRLAVHEALAALGERYRVPLILCYLGGMTQDRAATALGLSRAAVKKRLERGREQLRERLAHKGLGPTALLAALATPALACAVPPALADVAIRLAVPFATGSVAPGTVPPAVLSLAHAEVTPMVLSPLKALLYALPVLVAGVVLTGVPVRRETRAQDPAPPRAQPAPVWVDDKQETATERDAKWLAGEWKVVFIESRGRSALPDDDLADPRIIFKDGKAEVKDLRVPFLNTFAFKIDPTKHQKAIDVTFLDGERKGKTYEGIYVTMQNEVRICLRLEHTNLDRPKGFATISGAGLYAFFLRPVKEKDPPPKPVAKPKEAAPEKARPKFDVVLRDESRLYCVLTRSEEDFVKSLAVVGEHLELAAKIAESAKNPDATVVFFLRDNPKVNTGGYTGLSLKAVKAFAEVPADQRAAKLLEHHWARGELPGTAALFAPEAKGADDPNAEFRKQWDAIPVPQKTPFDGDAKKRDGYLISYRHGHLWADGVHIVGPTNPSKDNLHAIRGWVEGWQAGAKAGGTGDLPAKYAPYLAWREPEQIKK